jgi:predicted phage terminase large subunit-like protein
VIEERRPLLWSWHIDAICAHLQATAEGQIVHMLTNIPPRMTKSLLVSVLFPAWVWLRWPEARFFCASAVEAVVTRDAVKCHDLVDSAWYQARFAPSWQWSAEQNAKTNYRNTAGGGRVSLTVGQKVVGVDADFLLVDDPLDVRDAVPSRAALADHIEWYEERAYPRRTDQARSPTITIMQRLHEADLSGHLLESGRLDAALILPAIANGEQRSFSPLGFVDPRQPGELLCSRLSRSELAIMEERRPRQYASQQQQRPAPAEGAIFHKEWLRFWDATTLPPEFDYVVGSWDTTFRAGRSNDWCVGHTWGVRGVCCYLLEQIRKRMGYDQAKEEICSQSARWPSMRAVIVEKHATGAAIVSDLESEVPGIVAVTHQGESKESRAEAITPLFAAGQVYFPHPHQATWVQKVLLPEVLGFPVARHDDCVDTMTQALIWIQQNRVACEPAVYSVGRYR